MDVSTVDHSILIKTLKNKELQIKFWTLISLKNSETCTPAPLFNIGSKFAWSFLAATARQSFSRLGTTLNQGKGEFWVSLSKSNIF